MISLQVESYCDNCDGFEPVVIHTKSFSFVDNSEESNTIVKCDNARKCAAIYRHIQKEVGNKDAK